ncbi:hypothetical protein GCM10010169_35270 [Micromonospora fulviviridis]|uniref:hypothetical protein n=1 Tax=Micromonospora fulviviridis TaxID=47860 RepID=UPI0019A495DD|nr:hypothetical protein [Micromonospora fulviviridis]GGR87958.1 hypothetical protein GCM10010169_35270 [Micromonospora fulviviridis]
MTLTWSAQAKSPYAYTLGFFSDGQLVAAQKHNVADASLGRIQATYSSMGATTDFGDMTAAQRPTTVAFCVGGIDAFAVPNTRTEYLTADGTQWYKCIISSFPFGEVMNDHFRTLAPGQVVTDSWYGGSVTPRRPERQRRHAADDRRASRAGLSASTPGRIFSFLPVKALHLPAADSAVDCGVHAVLLHLSPGGSTRPRRPASSW